MKKDFKGFTSEEYKDGYIHIIDFVRKIYDQGHYIPSQEADRFLGYLDDCPCEIAFADNSAELLNLYQDDPNYIVDFIRGRLEKAFEGFIFEMKVAEINPCCIEIYPWREHSN